MTGEIGSTWSWKPQNSSEPRPWNFFLLFFESTERHRPRRDPEGTALFGYSLYPLSAIPNHFSARGLFHGRRCFHGPERGVVWGGFKHLSCTWFLLLLHQLHHKSSGIRSQRRLGTPALHRFFFFFFLRKRKRSMSYYSWLLSPDSVFRVKLMSDLGGYRPREESQVPAGLGSDDCSLHELCDLRKCVLKGIHMCVHSETESTPKVWDGRQGCHKIVAVLVVVLVAQLCLTLCGPVDCSPPGSFVHGDSPGKTTAVGCHALLQGIYPTQGLNPGLLHCRWILYRMSYSYKIETTEKVWW